MEQVKTTKKQAKRKEEEKKFGLAASDIAVLERTAARRGSGSGKNNSETTKLTDGTEVTITPDLRDVHDVTDYVDADQDNKPKTRKRRANGQFARKDENVLSPEDLRGLVRDGSHTTIEEVAKALNDEQLIELVGVEVGPSEPVPGVGQPEVEQAEAEVKVIEAPKVEKPKTEFRRSIGNMLLSEQTLADIYRFVASESEEERDGLIEMNQNIFNRILALTNNYVKVRTARKGKPNFYHQDLVVEISNIVSLMEVFTQPNTQAEVLDIFSKIPYCTNKGINSLLDLLNEFPPLMIKQQQTGRGGKVKTEERKKTNMVDWFETLFQVLSTAKDLNKKRKQKLLLFVISDKGGNRNGLPLPILRSIWDMRIDNNNEVRFLTPSQYQNWKRLKKQAVSFHFPHEWTGIGSKGRINRQWKVLTNKIGQRVAITDKDIKSSLIRCYLEGLAGKYANSEMAAIGWELAISRTKEKYHLSSDDVLAIRNSFGDVCNRIFANRQVFGDNAVQYHAHFVKTVLKPSFMGVIPAEIGLAEFNISLAKVAPNNPADKPRAVTVTPSILVPAQEIPAGVWKGLEGGTLDEPSMEALRQYFDQSSVMATVQDIINAASAIKSTDPDAIRRYLSNSVTAASKAVRNGGDLSSAADESI